MDRPPHILRGKTAVVTGSTRGIGLVIAASLAQAGAQLVLCGRSMASVEAAYAQFDRIPGVEVLGAECNVRELEQVEELARRAVERFGKIDLWFNNAGISGPYGPVAAMPAEAWRAVIDTNVNGTFYGTKVALQQMLPRGSGKIINLIGAGARESKREQPYLSPYLASKAAVLRFTQTVAAEYKHTPLSILAWSPGLVRTELVTGAEPLTPDAAATLQQFEPVLDRIGTPLAKVGEEALRLAGPDTDGVSGKVYEIKPSVWQLLRLILKR